MPLSDTAALVSSLELKDKFTPTVNKYDRALSHMEKQTSTFGKVGSHAAQGLGSAAANLTKLALVGAAAVGSQVKFGLDALRELGAVTGQTNAVLKSTGGVAGETADSIVKLSEKYEDLNALVDNKVIQSGENLLLTFTNIRTKAFEPTLQAALDMNQAMGGGEAGLQGTIQKLGKALNDPVKGLTALGRVGITFSDAQKAQIKDLVKHNDLYGAQKVILDELTKRFGGSFAAAGKEADGTFAALGDSVEDLQMALAEGVLPALVDVAKELSTTFKDPSTKSAVRDFGKGIGEAFRGAVKFAKQIPWAAIGDGLRVGAGAAHALMDVFIAAPDWLKTAVITGWGLNKLTGGALTGIGGDLIKGLGERFLGRGSSPVNPLFVSMAGIPGVGGVPATGAAGALGKIASIAQKVFIVGMVAEVADLIHGAISPGGGLENRTNTGDTLPGDTLMWPFGPKGTPKIDLGPFKNILGGDSTFTKGVEEAAADMQTFADRVTGDFGRIDTASTEFTGSLAVLTASSLKAAQALEKDWIKTIDPDKIGARSKAVTGKDATPAQIAAIRSRDILHQLEVITTKSKQTNEQKLTRLQALVKEGDPKTREKVKSAIADMKAKIAAEQAATTTAVSGGAASIVGAIAAHMGSLIVNVTTEITANGVTKASTHSNAYGPADSTNKGTSAVPT